MFLLVWYLVLLVFLFLGETGQFRISRFLLQLHHAAGDKFHHSRDPVTLFNVVNDGLRHLVYKFITVFNAHQFFAVLL
jgi:predicted secreted protein